MLSSVDNKCQLTCLKFMGNWWCTVIDKELLPGFIRWGNWVLLKYLFYLQSIKLLTGTFSNQSWSYLGPYLGSPWGPVQCALSPGPTISLPYDSLMGQLTRSALVELGMCFHLSWSPRPPRVLSSKCSILPWISSPMLNFWDILLCLEGLRIGKKMGKVKKL